ncbi:MAG TPA: hypothetical protein VFW28_12845 [Micropepsaceae bacterium]|nr:hypothetical protein [Micropepsaceae bacterium]
MVGLDHFEPHMGDHRIALVAAAHAHNRRPEIAHLGEMRIPVVADHAREYRPQHLVGADARVKAVHKFVDQLFGDVVIDGTAQRIVAHVPGCIAPGDKKQYFRYMFNDVPPCG